MCRFYSQWDADPNIYYRIVAKNEDRGWDTSDLHSPKSMAAVPLDLGGGQPPMSAEELTEAINIWRDTKKTSPADTHLRWDDNLGLYYEGGWAAVSTLSELLAFADDNFGWQDPDYRIMVFKGQHIGRLLEDDGELVKPTQILADLPFERER